MDYAIIDIGSNTVRFAIYHIQSTGFTIRHNTSVTLGLGNDRKKGCLTPHGIDKLCNALATGKQLLQEQNITHYTAIATASLRNLHNTQEVLETVAKRTGITVEILSGEVEAELDFLGSTYYVTAHSGLMLDVGGGSTELVSFTNRHIVNATSIPVGSLVMHQSYVTGITPTGKEIEAIAKNVEQQLASLPVFSQARWHTAIGLGGTAQTLQRMVEQLPDYAPKQAANTLTLTQVHEIIRQYLAAPQAFTVHLTQIAPDRLHTFLPGIVIIYTILDYFKVEELAISHYGLREGYLIRNILI